MENVGEIVDDSDAQLRCFRALGRQGVWFKERRL